jgi:hypothetical protein
VLGGGASLHEGAASIARKIKVALFGIALKYGDSVTTITDTAFLPAPEYKSEMTGMPNKSPEDRRICFY